MKPNASLKQDLTKTKGSLQKRLQAELQPYTDTPYLDSVVLLSHITQTSKSDLLANPDPPLTSQQQDHLDQALTRLRDGAPLPYVLGQWEFFQNTFLITEDVLIPRPETEGLVDLALAWLIIHPERRTCLEIGTGSGCIAVSLAKHVPDLHLIATDISKQALLIAQKNAELHQVAERIKFQQHDLLKGLTEKVDLIIANLPYIPTDKLKDLQVYHHEPRIALDGGPDGLVYIERILRDAPRHLLPGGVVILEIDEDCGSAALQLAHQLWDGKPIQLDQDLSGQDRYLTLGY
jgi:release factor glutamine methyltransferase